MSTTTLISLILLGVALVYFLFQPKKINHIYGYRTKRSRRDIKSWNLANSMASKGLLMVSVVNLLLSFLLTKESYMMLFIVVIIIEIIVLFVVIEKKLKSIK